MIKEKLKRVAELIEMVAMNDTKGCPDPVQGGCMGHMCTWCAIRELRVYIREEQKS